MSAVQTGSSHTPPTALPAIARLLATIVPDSRAPEGEPTLELASSAAQPPRLISATIIEGYELRARRVFDPPEVGFTAFLDGTQESRVAVYLPSGAPIVWGTVAAVIRERRNKRLYTWRHAVDSKLYASRSSVSATFWDQVNALGYNVCDTGESGAGAGGSSDAEHPFAMRDTAKHRVQADRELLEQSLALEWCRSDNGPILIDGPISGAEPVARSKCAVGVIKSHRTLYASGDALRRVLALGWGERSSAFLVTSQKRTSVASWYLRLRDSRGHDPMWGLVRVEVAAEERDIGARADQVSRWILAEAAPVSLPDSRWDKMVYGIRDCEEFLRAIR